MGFSLNEVNYYYQFNNRGNVTAFVDFKLTRDSYTHYEGSLANTTHAFVPGENMEPYFYGVDGVFNTDQESIPPGGKITGTVSYFLDKYDVDLAYKPNSNETNFTLTLDASDLPFLHSFDENKVEYALKIGWDSHNDRIIYK
ncbi:MAG: hypothetical protein K0S80_1955 [Neobacillus sp.]|nr:hypothetical protein [Neobacillus sp.]